MDGDDDDYDDDDYDPNDNDNIGYDDVDRDDDDDDDDFVGSASGIPIAPPHLIVWHNPHSIIISMRMMKMMMMMMILTMMMMTVKIIKILKYDNQYDNNDLIVWPTESTQGKIP